MKRFRKALDDRRPDPAGDSDRRWLFVPYDQLSDAIGPLSRADPADLGIVLVESAWKPARRRYHRQKLQLILSNQRHFALEQAARGVAVRYVTTRGDYHSALEAQAKELGSLRVQQPAERELRNNVQPLVETGALEILPHEGWLTSHEQFLASRDKGGRFRMDRFYRRVRKDTGILMSEGDPLGGRFSFDADNRKPWKGEPRAPQPPRFDADPIRDEVAVQIAEHFPDHPGELDAAALPATRSDSLRLWDWAKSNCLESFGPYEDAMSTRSTGLFHTRVSSLLNISRLLPRQVVDDVVALPGIPLASREGFVRQVLGWREFVRWIHLETDGFRSLAETVPQEPNQPEPAPSFLGASNDLPPAYWGTRSGLGCLDHVVSEVWREGYSHHITRLMVLGNLATLLDVSPRQLTTWFWCAYTDAFDWVVEPNVLGMGTFAIGDLMTTKPYVAGSRYIDKMSDYCKTCLFDPKSSCPITPLYWQFLERHREKLSGNPRIQLALRSSEKRSRAKKQADQEVFERVSRALARGEQLTPESITRQRELVHVE